MTKSARIVAVVALIAALLSFAKFNHCRGTNWVSPDVYIHMCYSDISALYGAREINTDQWPYASTDNSLEYPVLTGVVTYLTGLLIDDPNGYRAYFDVNALLIVLLLFASVFILWRLAPKYTPLFPIAPAVFGSLFINWDIWAVVTTLAAIYYFDKKKYEQSGIWLGISIATKFFPIVLLLPIAIIFYRSNQLKQLIRYLLTTFSFWAVINIPIAIIYFDGWWRFFKLNLERGEDFGSIWYGLSLLNIKVSNLDLLYPLISLTLFALLTYYLFKLKQIPTLATVALFAVVIFTTFSKVYSPQYVLWLTPLAVIALSNRKQQISFWFWQATEIIYHLAIWQYLALFTGAKFGLPAAQYAGASLLRVVGILFFTYILMRDLAVSSTAKKD